MSGHQYIVLTSQIVGNSETGFGVEYTFDGRVFDDRQAAIDHGFALRRSDDFNIGVLDGGKLVSCDWMNEPVDTDPGVLAHIVASAGLTRITP